MGSQQSKSIYLHYTQFSNVFFYSASNRVSLILFKGKVVFLECVMISEHKRFPDIDSAGILL